MSSLLFVSAFAPLITQFDQTIVVGRAFESPDGVHFLGTDQLGRDMLSRMLFGLRNTVGVALATAIFSIVLGLSASIIAMMFGRWVFGGLFIIAHAISSLPPLFWGFFYIPIAGASVRSLVVAMTIALSARVFRFCCSGSFETSFASARGALKPNAGFHWFKIVVEVLGKEKMMLVAKFGILFNTTLLTDFALSF